LPAQPQNLKRNSSLRILAAARAIAVREGAAHVSIDAITRPELLRNDLKTDLARMNSESTDPETARILFFALQGIRFHKLLKLPDGGSAVPDDLAARIEEMNDDAT